MLLMWCSTVRTLSIRSPANSWLLPAGTILPVPFLCRALWLILRLAPARDATAPAIGSGAEQGRCPRLGEAQGGAGARHRRQDATLVEHEVQVAAQRPALQAHRRHAVAGQL